MLTKASIIILSHINDFKIDSKIVHIDFAAFLILKFPNTKTEIDPEKEFSLFEKRNG